jgi:hypothetical protein
MLFSSTHHTFNVEPWNNCGPEAVKVTQADDDDAIVLLLRDRLEVEAFCGSLLGET